MIRSKVCSSMFCESPNAPDTCCYYPKSSSFSTVYFPLRLFSFSSCYCFCVFLASSCCCARLGANSNLGDEGVVLEAPACSYTGELPPGDTSEGVPYFNYY